MTRRADTPKARTPLFGYGFWPRVAGLTYIVVGLSTFVYLTFFDGYGYTAWNWLIAIPVNAFLAQIWPLYWLVLRPLLG